MSWKGKRKDAAVDYLKFFPDLERWINTCVSCGARGYKPEMPEEIYPWFNLAAHNLRRLFSPLYLDQFGHCPQCRKAIELSNG